ncbi:MAG: UvrD-helicase domain-containing protein, partial [Deltaproteobacteria bacterium]
MKPYLNLTIIPAGAGSGKTHRIQEELSQRIKDGLEPEKVVAVTFTEAAAAELRGRIRAALVKEGLLDQALRLDQAYISTIHGFGLRLITEFAFDGGISPTPRKLSDDEQSMLVSKSLARSEYADKMTQRLTRYGYSADVTNQKSVEQVFRESILKFISTLRTIDRDTGSEQLARAIEQQIRTLYGEPRLAEHLKSRLLDAITALLRSFPSGVAELSTVADTIKETLRKEFIYFKQAEKGTPLDTD